MKLSIIIPALNESENIQTTLEPLQPLRKLGHEIILSDGGSIDNTKTYATPLVDTIVESPKGRAKQMNAGAVAAQNEVLLFLHADTTLPDNAATLITEALTQNNQWGRFDVSLSGDQLLLRLVEFMMNLRSRISGIATGDQAMFINRPLFDRINGFPDIALMEDIAISRELKRHCFPARITKPVRTSSRRWEQNGVIKTILLMWRLRLAYFFGADPKRLAAIYQKGR